MNGAEALLKGLVAGGIKVFFANPGTSEMHLVRAIGDTCGVRAVLCLFEGVVTGAADGYARMKGRPAATLLHVGCGLSNAMANLHNAKKAYSPIVNIVGDHATYHQALDTPLATDVAAHAKLHAHWVKISESAKNLGPAGGEAVSAALSGNGKIATLIVPANHAWEEAGDPSFPFSPPEEIPVPENAIERTLGLLQNGKKTGLLLGGIALREEALLLLGKIAKKTGATLLCETFPVRLRRGEGGVPTARIPYFAEKGADFLKEYEQLILVGGRTPVAFFAYPDKPSLLAPEGCAISTLATPEEGLLPALTTLAERLGAAEPHPPQARVAPLPPRGALTPKTVGESLAILLPENAVVVDEAITASQAIYDMTVGAKAHDWLALTGGAIGIGLPLALGAAVACPDRKVVALQADGSALYTLQALWTMAREQTNVTVVLLNNSRYAILDLELSRVGAKAPSDKTLSMFDLGHPDIDWTALSQSLGVPAVKVLTAEEFHLKFAEAVATPGPHLIEAVIPGA